MFSSRTNWDTRPSALFSLLQKKRSAGIPIIDLTESNPTRCGFSSHPLPIDSVALQRSSLYEPEPKGLQSARETIAAWYENQGVSVKPESIVLTASTSEAYTFLLRLLCDIRDSIAIPKPSYPLFDTLCRLNDVQEVHYHLRYDGEWHIDFPSLEEHLSAGARGVILVHPNNPTGSYVKKHERGRLLHLLATQQKVLIVDEVFGSFPFGHDDRRAGSFAGEREVLTFTVNGLSKVVALPQMKLAWIVVSGPAKSVHDALERLEVIADTYLSVGTPVQHAVAGMLERQPEKTAHVLSRVRENYAALKRIAGADSPVTILPCEGGWNAILQLPAIRSDEDWALHLLDSHDLLTHPGHLFDFEMKSCLVLSLLPEPQSFAEGVRRLFAAGTAM